MPGPTVSVVVAAYNAMPYLTRCITSVAEQSIGQERLELIVVNDGSTDGTAAELDRLSQLYPDLLRVFHQENSGGPSAPRNVGLDHAMGTYVFILDADDYIGPEALERMVAMAEENGTDIVLGKMVGVGGRRLPQSMFKRNQPKTDVFNSRVYWALNPLKLYRRSLLERHSLRFPTGLPVGEDQKFVALAYLHASGVSVIADYDCLFCSLREDGGNITQRTRGTEPRLRFLPIMVNVLLENVPPGPGRDHLAHRHLTVEVEAFLNHLRREPREDQQKILDQFAEIVEPLWHEGMNEHLSAMARLRIYLVRHRMLDEVLELGEFERQLAKSKVSTPVLVVQGKAYARYPFLRDPERKIPDSCYDVTGQLGVRHLVTRAEMRGTTLHLAGHAYLHRVETRDVSTYLLLRERNTQVEYELPVKHVPSPGAGADEDCGRYVYDLAGFEATVDVATAADGKPLDAGLWDISLIIGAQGVSKQARIGSRRADDVSGKATTRIVTVDGSPRAVTLYTTNPYGNFTLDLAETKHRVRSGFAFDDVHWAADAPTELEITGRCTLAEFPEGELKVTLASDQGDTYAVRPVVDRDGRVVVRIPVTKLPAGLWSGDLHLGPWKWALPQPPRDLPAAKWRRIGLPWYAKSGPAGKKGRALRVARTDLVKAVAQRLR
ncbi:MULTISPECIES: glycosyltransferase family 2 protein [unclassified Streptomyces]|uniref:glycosyltransferase family 2 protein n=1 Tax=unclassified Streptomyces TaxID=2593676 RepID=UPI0033CE5847